MEPYFKSDNKFGWQIISNRPSTSVTLGNVKNIIASSIDNVVPIHQFITPKLLRPKTIHFLTRIYFVFNARCTTEPWATE